MDMIQRQRAEKIMLKSKQEMMLAQPPFWRHEDATNE